MLNKDDLWDALTEYPDAKRALIEAGRKMLMKDKMLDEEAAKKQDLDGETIDKKVDRIEVTLLYGTGVGFWHRGCGIWSVVLGTGKIDCDVMTL